MSYGEDERGREIVSKYWSTQRKSKIPYLVTTVRDANGYERIASMVPGRNIDGQKTNEFGAADETSTQIDVAGVQRWTLDAVRLAESGGFRGMQ